MKEKKLIKILIDNIRHDFGFYNPKWKWKNLPEPLNKSYNLLYPTLLKWQENGYVNLFEGNGEKMIEIIQIPEE
ncbi:hypothetical protein EDM00_06300 [Ornithobacterium rhinotracheale]|uniref:hypothetical protein n=1 Tax=Ornithobacterium rhinotracheale TaxID=28251 RepID=UPI00129CA3E7|nr:hypothetical protein [Ornithobacterium rhinotracheale]MRI63599.1 hypothetical protein [Ornithobacterium rhinotracheale]